MKRLSYILFLLSTLLQAQQQQVLELCSSDKCQWMFRGKESTWQAAKVPGTIYADLQRNKNIPEPYLNEKEVQWVGTADWEYVCTFDLKEDQPAKFSHAELSMNDVDTYAKVYLNDSLVMACDNMFRSWTKDVKRFLKKGENELRVKFGSAVNRAKAEAAKLPYTLPEGERVFVRKAQFHFGWDFAPRFAGCSLGAVKLNFWNDLRLTNFFIDQLHLDSSRADLKATVIIESDKKQEVSIRLSTSDHQANIKTQKKLTLKKGLNMIDLDVSIDQPALWWCRGLGRPDLYKFTLDISTEKINTVHAEKIIGLRTIELVREALPVTSTGSVNEISNSTAVNSSFYFRLNGKPVFTKGANYIPSSSLPFEIPDSTFPKLAAQLNMNMLRVWGGGVYAGDAFYSACDREGILVWQDLMFACAMYPGDDAFLQNVKQEVTEQALRLRDHPCLALWCGNNESNEGWHNWGWQKQFSYSKKDSASIWHDYQKLFHELIPGVLASSSPHIAYHPSSPLIGWGRAESMDQGDSHYWGVWWGKEPFEAYVKKTGRFMSEFGFQGMPSLSSFERFCRPEELSLDSRPVQDHQKNKGGFQTIQTYMERDYPVPVKFEDYIYVSQLLQARGMVIAIASHRRNKPYCMGSLFWQLNDCWPAISWSAIDFYGEPKALYYEARRQFRTVAVSVTSTKDSVTVHVVSDSLQALSGQLHLRLNDFYGKALWKRSAAFDVKANDVSHFSFSKKDLPPFDTASVYLHASYESKLPAETNFFFARPKDLNLPKTDVSVKKISPGVYEVKSEMFAKDVALYFENGTKLSDNFFDLEPGVLKTIKIDRSYVRAGQEKPRVLILNNLINLHEK